MIETYPEMNKRIKALLRMNHFDSTALYAAQRIEDLEKKVETENGWILCEDTLPENGGIYPVLIVDANGEFLTRLVQFHIIECPGDMIEKNWHPTEQSVGRDLRDRMLKSPNDYSIVAWYPMPQVDLVDQCRYMDIAEESRMTRRASVYSKRRQVCNTRENAAKILRIIWGRETQV